MSGITSINGDATAAQLLTVGTSGTDFAIADDAVGGHAFNLPNAGAAARGVVSTGAQTFAGAKTFSSAPIISALTATTVPYLDASKVLTSSTVTPTELGLLSGKTSLLGGAGSSTANALVRWSGTGGATIQNSSTTLDNAGVLSIGTNTTGNADNMIFYGTCSIANQVSHADRLQVRATVFALSAAASASTYAQMDATGLYMYPTPGVTTNYSNILFDATALTVQGSDIPVIIKGGTEQSFKGITTGSAILGKSAVATNATGGFAYIPSCAGTPTGTPVSQTGYVPLVCDSSGSKLYAYLGGAWVAMN